MKNPFSFFIEDNLHEYLRKKAYEEHTSMSKIINEIIQKNKEREEKKSKK